MKITAFLMLITILTVSASSVAQKITLKENNTTLEQVLDKVRQQSGFDFFYSDELIINAKPVTVNLKDVTLNDAMLAILNGQALDFKIQDSTVILKPKQFVALNMSKSVRVASNVGGIVYDTLQRAIIGATVRLSPGKFSMATGKTGEFSFLNVPAGNYTLTVSMIGFKTLSVEIDLNEGAKYSGMVLVLKETQSSLGEVTVNTGYQRIKIEQSTGATARIGTKQYESRINTNFLDGIVNKLPGVLINNDIKFDGNPLFQIRGISTISGNRSPLIVVDGYPTNLTLDMLDPNEIKSVTVLKDAASATIYGVRASNGVIIVERKRGEEGKPVINFRSTFSITPKENYSRYNWDPNSTGIRIDVDKTQYQNYGPYYPYLNTTTYGNFNFARHVYTIIGEAAGAISAADAQAQYNVFKSYDNSADYNRLFARAATANNYTLNVSGGNHNALYYISTNYRRNNASQPNNNGDQIQLTGHTSINFTKRLSFSLTTDFSRLRSNSAPVPSLTQFYPYEHFEDAAGNPLATFQGSKVNPAVNKTLMGLGYFDSMYYPLTEMNEVNGKTQIISNRVIGGFNYNLAKGLDLSFGGTYESSKTDNRNYSSMVSSANRQLVNYYTKIGTDGSIAYDLPVGDQLRQSTNELSGFSARAQLNFNKQLGKDHFLNAIVGGEISGTKTQGYSTASFGYDNQNLIQAPVNYAQLLDVNYRSQRYYLGSPLGNPFSQTYTDDRILSAYSNVVYSYQSKYSLSGSIRVDQSNLFGTNPKYRYKPLWSMGFAWNVDQEDFMKNLNWLTQLKLRAAYGFNGNVAKDALPQVIAYSGNNLYYPYGGATLKALSLLQYANSGLRWEQTQNTNLGLDFTLFKKINGHLDAYQRNSTDLMGKYAIDPAKGGDFAMTNSSSIRNRGIEFGLNADFIKQKSFNWNSSISFSYNRSKVTKVYNNQIKSTSISLDYMTAAAGNFLEGYQVGSLFYFRAAGLDDKGMPLVYNKDGSTHTMQKFAQNTDDLNYAGTTVPPINIGWGNRVDIGRFYANVMVHYYGGHKAIVPMPDPRSGTRLLNGAGNYWKKSGDENIPGMLPSLTGYMYSYYLNQTDIYLVRADYFTLGDVTMSYNFADMAFVKKAGLKQLSLSLQASNLYSVGFNKYKYSQAIASTNSAKTYMTPTYSIALFTTF